jgi:hypothetical protein
MGDFSLIKRKSSAYLRRNKLHFTFNRNISANITLLISLLSTLGSTPANTIYRSIFYIFCHFHKGMDHFGRLLFRFGLEQVGDHSPSV